MEDLLDYQEGLSFMNLVDWLVVQSVGELG